MQNWQLNQFINDDLREVLVKLCINPYLIGRLLQIETNIFFIFIASYQTSINLAFS